MQFLFISPGFWRLAYDGHPTPSWLHLPTATWTCRCWAAGTAVGRQHMFWVSPVKTTVTTRIIRALGVGLGLGLLNLQWICVVGCDWQCICLPLDGGFCPATVAAQHDGGCQ
jgi:hypothetical protein